MTARSWKATRLLLVTLVALVAFSYQVKRKTFIWTEEVNALDSYVKDTLKYIADEYNKESEDLYNFRIIRILKIMKQMTNHLEYHITLEMQRTTCLKTETNLCDIQKGELHKEIQCYFSVYAIPWAEVFKTLKKNCTNSN